MKIIGRARPTATPHRVFINQFGRERPFAAGGASPQRATTWRTRKTGRTSTTAAPRIGRPDRSPGKLPRAPRQRTDVPSPATVPTTIPADATDIRATLLVGYSAVRPSATAINGAPFALSSMGTALREDQ